MRPFIVWVAPEVAWVDKLQGCVDGVADDFSGTRNCTRQQRSQYPLPVCIRCSAPMNQHARVNLGRLILKKQGNSAVGRVGPHYPWTSQSRDISRRTREQTSACNLFPRSPLCIVTFVDLTLGDKIPRHGMIPAPLGTLRNR